MISFVAFALLMISCLLLNNHVHGFIPSKHSPFTNTITKPAFQHREYASAPQRLRSETVLSMGLFDFFKPKKSASASHILVKGSDAKSFLIELKGKLNASKDVPRAFAEAASQYSTCPSSRKGGSLGTFQQGQMVPAFDKVVFNNEVGQIHGPVSTPFGEHLILIESREE